MHICAITTISKVNGAPRIVPAVAIPHPLGDPALSANEEKILRRKIVEKALKTLLIKIEKTTVFEEPKLF